MKDIQISDELATTAWQSVDTAPKDGSEILARFPKQFGGWVTFVAISHPDPHGIVGVYGHFAQPTQWMRIPA